MYCMASNTLFVLDWFQTSELLPTSVHIVYMHGSDHSYQCGIAQDK